ncbi:hypothetical protein D3C75_1231820 [compost metagenome]
MGVFDFVSGFGEAGRFLHRTSGKESGASTNQRPDRPAHRAHHQPGECTEAFAGGGVGNLADHLIGHAQGGKQQAEGKAEGD